MFHFPFQGGHSIFGGGGGMTQSRHQPSVPPLNQSPGIRAQVPHQFLSPQVVMLLQCFLQKKRFGGGGGLRRRCLCLRALQSVVW